MNDTSLKESQRDLEFEVILMEQLEACMEAFDIEVYGRHGRRGNDVTKALLRSKIVQHSTLLLRKYRSKEDRIQELLVSNNYYVDRYRKLKCESPPQDKA